jgi:predicted GNAT family acetyltransferase
MTIPGRLERSGWQCRDEELHMSTDANVELKESNGMGTFLIRGTEPEAPDIVAEMAFQWEDGAMNILHTAIRPGYEDEGLAKALVSRAVEHARAENIKLKPTCRFAKRILEEEMGDVDDVTV